MPVSHPYKTVFVHIPKCAGSSIEEWLMGFTPLVLHREKMDRFHDLQCVCSKIHGLPMHFGMADIQKECGPCINDYYSFAVVRDPFTRILSHYLFMKRATAWNPTARLLQYKLAKEAKDFREFVRLVAEQPTLMPLFAQHLYLRGLSGRIEVDTILHFEQLPAVLLRTKYHILRKNISKPSRYSKILFGRLGQKNKSTPIRIAEFYDKETAGFVGKHVADDLHLFNYYNMVI